MREVVAHVGPGRSDPAMLPAILLLAAAAAAPVPKALVLSAPDLEGGSEIRISDSGHLEVRGEDGRTRWSLGLGAPARFVVADERAVYAATRRELRAFAGGVARWSLDLGAPAHDLRRGPGGLLAVALPAGTVFIDPSAGRFCTPRAPCPGLPAYRTGPVGVPYLDLVGLGVPGLGLILNPQLLAGGDLLGGVVSPGPLPGVAPAPTAPVAPKIRSVEVGTVQLENGAHGKVRSFHIGGHSTVPPRAEAGPR